MFNVGGDKFQAYFPSIFFKFIESKCSQCTFKAAEKGKNTGREKKGRLFHIYGKSPKHNLSICHVFHVFPSAPHFRPHNIFFILFDQNEWK